MTNKKKKKLRTAHKNCEMQIIKRKYSLHEMNDSLYPDKP